MTRVTFDNFLSAPFDIDRYKALLRSRSSPWGTLVVHTGVVSEIVSIGLQPAALAAVQSVACFACALECGRHESYSDVEETELQIGTTLSPLRGVYSCAMKRCSRLFSWYLFSSLLGASLETALVATCGASEPSKTTES